jgi:hypothetical protein
LAGLKADYWADCLAGKKDERKVGTIMMGGLMVGPKVENWEG